MTLSEWAFGEDDPDDNIIEIHVDKRHTSEHVRRYIESSALEVTAAVLGPEDGEARKKDIILCHRAALMNTENEAYHKISISHKFYDPRSYVLFFPNGDGGLHLQLPRHSDGTNSKGGCAKNSPML